MPVGAVIGAVGASVAGGAIAAGGAKKAGKVQADAANRATDTQLQMYEQTREDLGPYRGVGENALYSLADLYGLPTKLNPEGGQPFDENALRAFEASPDYRFAFDQGLKAVDQSAAARGNLLSGGQLKRVSEYGQGLATQNFGNYFNRLLSLASLGEGAASQSGNAALATGRGVAQTQLAAGEAQAAGTVGAYNALGGGFADAGNQLMTQNYLKNLSPSSYVTPTTTYGVGVY